MYYEKTLTEYLVKFFINYINILTEELGVEEGDIDYIEYDVRTDDVVFATFFLLSGEEKRIWILFAQMRFNGIQWDFFREVIIKQLICKFPGVVLENKGEE